jgi:hypothetical protein
MNKEETYIEPRPEFLTDKEKEEREKMDAATAELYADSNQGQLEEFERDILDKPLVPEPPLPEATLPEATLPEATLPEATLQEEPQELQQEVQPEEPQEAQPEVQQEEELPQEEPSEEELKKRIRNLTRKDCNLFVDILENKYSGRPMSQPDDEEDRRDRYANAYIQPSGKFYNDDDNLIINKYKHSNFNMTITRDNNLLEEYVINGQPTETKNLIDNLLNDPNAPRIPLNEDTLENIQFRDRSPIIVENDLNINVILFEVLDRVSNEMAQINKIFLNGEIIYDEDTVKSIIDTENLFNPIDTGMKRGASYYKYLTQLQQNVVNEEYITKNNLLHKIYDKLNEVTSDMSNETFNKYFIDILSILIFFSDLTANKLTQKIMDMFNVSEKDILYKFAIARVIYDSNGNPIIDVSQLGAKTYEEELLNLSQNTKKLSQLFGIEPSEVKNKLFTNTVEIFMEQNADIIITKTFTSFFYLNDNIYSLSLFKYSWNLNKNTCTIDVKYRWVINDMILLKLIGDYTKILISLLKMTSLPPPDFTYQFLQTEINYNNFKYYIINCIKMLKCILKGDPPKEINDQINDQINDELDYSSSNQKIEGKIGQKWNKIKERYSEIVEDSPKKVMAAKAIGSVGTAVGLGVAGMAIAGVALSSVLGGKKSKKNMKRKNKKRVTKKYKKQNARNKVKNTRKGVKKAKKTRNTKKQRGKK